MPETSARKYTLRDLPTERSKKYLTRAAVRGDDCLAVVNWMEPRPEAAPPHSHPFDQLSFVLEGEMLFEVDGMAFELEAGDVLVIPADAPHTARATGQQRALNLDIFAPPREDYLYLAAHQSEPSHTATTHQEG